MKEFFEEEILEIPRNPKRKTVLKNGRIAKHGDKRNLEIKGFFFFQNKYEFEAKTLVTKTELKENIHGKTKQ